MLQPHRPRMARPSRTSRMVKTLSSTGTSPDAVRGAPADARRVGAPADSIRNLALARFGGSVRPVGLEVIIALVAVLRIVVTPDQVAVLVPVVGVGREDVEEEPDAAAAGRRAAPEALPRAVLAGRDAPLHEVALVHLLAVQAADFNRDLRRAEGVGVRVEAVVGHGSPCGPRDEARGARVRRGP